MVVGENGGQDCPGSSGRSLDVEGLVHISLKSIGLMARVVQVDVVQSLRGGT